MIFKKKYGFHGDYKSWDAAASVCKGYASADIMEITLASVLKVKNGEAAFERDSALFDKPQYSPGLLVGLLKAGLSSGNELKVLDFGGALGSHYFQNRNILSPVKIREWIVVEQPHYIEVGNAKVGDGILQFRHSIDEVENADILIVSSVLQYLPDPYAWVEKLISKGIRYILIDRTAFNREKRDRLTVQRVPPEIYEASYPAWFFDEQRFLNAFGHKYNLLVDFDATIDKVKTIPSYYKGFLFEKQNA